ncbi:3-beta-glucan synthase) (Protein GLUCAN SYNTHASE-LIKE 12) [Durusdinium trenchii]|uniref:3-beta-glucan synthase (Protein GLUCAN SYNTHASE-LIKE 12 n=1 Tax=Durusdinium trenchii TaxID=1381693 RepID=A0ABP0PZX2_9DINO
MATVCQSGTTSRSRTNLSIRAMFDSAGDPPLLRRPSTGLFVHLVLAAAPVLPHSHSPRDRAWLETQRDLREKDLQLKALLGDNDVERPLWMLFTEAVLLRIIESLSEHALHAPEYLAMIFHQLRWAQPNDDRTAMLREATSFTLDCDLLHAGVDEMRKNTNPFTGGINFDDMNDLGEARVLDQQRIQKTFLESVSWRVLYDLLDNFGPVFTIKLWVFFLAFYVHLGSLADQNDSFFAPRKSRSDAVQVMALLDATLLVLAELGLLWHGLSQRRLCRSPGRFKSRVKRAHRLWTRRRFMSLIVGVVSLGAMVVVGQVGQNLCNLTPQETFSKNPDCSDPTALSFCAGYAVVRLFFFLLITRRTDIPFVHGSPKSLQKQRAWSTPDANLSQDGTNSAASFMTVVSDPPIGPIGKEGKGSAPFFVWLFVLLLCFAFEVIFVAPLVSGFSFSGFCGDSCSDRLFAFSADLEGFTVHPFPSECVACVLSVMTIYLLVGMTAFLDLHFLFYLVIGIGGYAMGEHRGLRNVASSALRHLDLDASTRRQDHHDTYSTISDGRAMECIFGSAWRLVWSCAVESLYEDCLISDAAANNMVHAARTFRWKDPAASQTEFAQVSQRFQRLRFRATQLRGGSWKQAGRSCCISGLQVRHGPRSNAESYSVDKVAAKLVKVTSAVQHTELMQVLDDRLIATTDVPGLGVKSGWQLLSQSSQNGGSGTSTPQRERSRGSSLNIAGRPLKTSPSRNSMAEDLLNLRNASNFPVELSFADPEGYREVEIVFPRPRCIYAVSFLTTGDERQFDPVCWEIDGSVDGSSWMRLQTQSGEFDTPSMRRCPVETFFVTEPWCKPQGSSLVKVDLQKIPAAVSERLCFFANSLRAILKSGDLRPGRDTLLDRKVGNVPTLTQVVPVYEEQVLLSEEFLCASDGRNSNLGFTISQAEDQWEIFARKQGMAPRELYNSFTCGELHEWVRQAEVDQDWTKAKEIRELIFEVRFWASQRSQTVSRTVLGAIQYHKVLEMLPSVQASPQTNLEGLVQLFISHQTYGHKKQKEEVDQDIRSLIWRYRQYPVFLVCDYDAELARPSLKEMVTCHAAREHNFTGRFQYASLLLAFNENYVQGQPEENIVKVVEVLPRVYPLVLGELEHRPPAAKTQGKAGNQLQALRFAPGHYLQMMDANMGAFFGEACKVPFILQHFQPAGSDRRTVQARIIGFREHIFTGSHGAVGAAMADAEWTFGTICQRFLAGLGARMHYGHPDFLDGFWASNRGSMSKASPVLNLSEDIFAGFNVLMRGERSTHVDCLEWEKGREVSFNSASLFFTKVASGNVGVMRSRDLKTLTGSMNIADSFSFYFASVGFYLYNVVTDISMSAYVFIFVLLTLSSKSLDDIGKLDSLLAAEWVISFGTLAMFPRLMELTLEYGIMEGFIRFLPSIPGAVLVFTFMNKSIAEAVGSTMQTGIASYVSTGRPPANDHYGWRDCYFFYRESHYYPAVRILIMYAVYRSLAETFNVAALPMMVLLGTACVWLAGPMLFCPQPTFWSLRDDLSEFWCFVIGTPHAERSVNLKEVNLEERLAAQKDDATANLYDVWLFDKLKHKRAPMLARVMEIAVAMALLVVMLAVVFGTMVDQIRSVVLLVLLNYFILALWRVFGRPTILMMLSGVLWICAVPFVLNSQSLGGQYGTLLVAFILTFQALTVIEKALLLGAWVCLRPDPDCASMPESSIEELRQKRDAARRVQSYDAVVEYFYLNFMSYQWHLYVSIMLLAVNLVVQLGVAVLEMLGGLQSWWLLGSKLRGGCCRVRRPEYKPPGSDHDPPSERRIQLSGEREGLRSRLGKGIS